MSPTIGTNIPSLNIATPISPKEPQTASGARVGDAPAPASTTQPKTGLLQKTQALLHRLTSGAVKHTHKYSLEVTVPAPKAGQPAFKDHIISINSRTLTTAERIANTAKAKLEQLERITLKDLSDQTKTAMTAANGHAIEAQTALKEAITAQYDLRTAFIQYAHASGNDLSAQIMDCDRKISELMNLSGSLIEAAKKNQDVPTALATQSVSNVVNEMRLDMHGTTSLVHKKFTEIHKRMDALEAQKDTLKPRVFAKEVQRLQTLLKKTEALLEEQKTRQAQGKKGAVYDPQTLDAIRTSLDSAGARLNEFERVNINREFMRMAEGLQKSYQLPTTSDGWGVLINANRFDPSKQICLEQLQTLFTALNKEPHSIDIEATTAIVDQIIGNNKLFRSLFSDLTQLEGESKSIAKAFHNECEKLLAIAKKIQTSANPNTYETGDAINKMLLSPISVSTLAESKLRGLSPDFALAELAVDGNLEGDPKELGQGALNTVFLCKYKSPTTGEEASYVFKSEYNGRQGFFDFGLAGLGYKRDTPLVGLNIIATEVAAKIGCESAIAQSKIGALNGQFGLFMEQGRGSILVDLMEPKNTDGNPHPGFTVNGQVYSLADLPRALTPAQQKTFAINLIQELTKLEWADALSGQLDRHEGNYLFDLNPTTTAVKITGIDNDFCFSKELDGLARSGALDFSRNPGFAYGFGVNQMFKPLFITQEIKDKLLAIDVEEYTKSLQGKLDADAIAAAVSRLADAKRHAETCSVLSNSSTAHELATMFQTIADEMTPVQALRAQEQAKIQRGESIDAERAQLATKNFITRDFYQLQPMFAALARP